MTAGECVARADLLRPNAVSEQEKLRWCQELEDQLNHEFYPRYVQPPAEEEAPQGASQPLEEEALSGSGPYEEMYVLHVMSKIDLANQETDAYNVDAALARAALDEYRKDYHRTHVHV